MSNSDQPSSNEIDRSKSLPRQLVTCLEVLKGAPPVSDEKDYRKWASTLRVSKSIDIINKHLGDIVRAKDPADLGDVVWFVKKWGLYMPGEMKDWVRCLQTATCFFDDGTKAKVKGLWGLMARETGLDSYIRLSCANAVYDMNGLRSPEDMDLYISISQDSSVSAPIRFEACKILLISDLDPYPLRAREVLKGMSADVNILPSKRYDMLLELSNSKGGLAKLKTASDSSTVFLDADESYAHFIIRCYYELYSVCTPECGIREKVLCAQYMLNANLDASFRKSIISQLFELAKNRDIPEKVRADALDVLYRKGDEAERKDALELLTHDIGFGAIRKGMDPRTIYQNSQNVHLTGYVERFLEIFSILPEYNEDRLMLDVGRVLSDRATTEEERNNALASLHRIKRDTATFGPNDFKMMDILAVVWNHIGHLVSREEDDAKDEKYEFLTQRLFEEFLDMEGWCASGHVARLANVFSGIDDRLTIDFKHQIVANAYTKLQAMIEKENDKDTIMIGMISEPETPERIVYEDFVARASDTIKSDLEAEFVDEGYVTREYFDKSFDGFINDLIG